MKKKIGFAIAIIALIAVLGGVIYFSIKNSEGTNKSETTTENKTEQSSDTSSTKKTTTSTDTTVTQISDAADGIYSASDLFTDRDLTQTADTTDATTYTLSDGNDIHITTEGVYVITGTAKDVTIYVEAESEDKVQIVLDGVSITNTDFPCIYVKNADKVFVTTTNTENTLTVTGTFTADGDTNTDGVIFAKDDITLNGIGTLTIKSSDNGIVGKDDLKITGGTYNITASNKAIEANDSIRVAGGKFTINATDDGLHAENDDDDSVGYIYIGGGEFTINAGDDGIHGTTVVQIDGGTLTIKAAEAIEGTYIQINGGDITISASDDGINAAKKSTAYKPTVVINDGNIKITMGQGDTDGIDSNGDIIINGGTIDVTGNSTFDYDGTATHNGGTIIVNGTQTDAIPNQFMGGQMGGGPMGGNMDGQQMNGNMPNQQMNGQMGNKGGNKMH